MNQILKNIENHENMKNPIKLVNIFSLRDCDGLF